MWIDYNIIDLKEEGNKTSILIIDCKSEQKQVSETRKWLIKRNVSGFVSYQTVRFGFDLFCKNL